MIRTESIIKTFDKVRVLDELSLSVKEGSIYGLVGPNGAGKTTLIKNLVGIFRPDRGEIWIDGEKVDDGAEIKGRLGYVPDFPNYYDRFKVADFVDFYRNTYPSWNEERFHKLRELFKLDLKKKIRQLSKGMKTQLAIQLNLSVMPKVLIMDEPTSGLDPVIRREVLNLIVQEVSLNNTTVLISTHNLSELEQICDHIGIMNKGKILMETGLEEMKEQIRKIQVAFKDELPGEIRSHKGILSIESMGKVHHLVVQEGLQEVLEEIKKYQPILLETVDMSLEEIFIQKMGGEGYGFKGFTF